MESREHADDYYDDEDYPMEEQAPSQDERPPERFRVLEPEPIIENRSSVLLSRVHDSSNPQSECSYCKGKRQTL